MSHFNRARWRIEELYGQVEAHQAVYHAEWFVRLSWWKRWVVMVLAL